MKKKYFEDLISELRKRNLSKESIALLKRKLAKKHRLSSFPTDIEVFLNAGPEDIRYLKQLQTKPTRSLSGVAVVAVMTKPFRCPHGRCSICPGGPDSAFGEVPQSYTGKEPATMRAIRAGFDPYLQVFNRLEQYIVLGHVPDKIELIIMGGTFPSFPKRYQDDFIKYCFKAMNDFSGLFFSKGELDMAGFKDFFRLPGDIGDPERAKAILGRLKKMKTRTTLKAEQKKNEKAKIRCIGLTIETRPDYANKEHAEHMLNLGCTRVELGIQSVYDDVLDRIDRGHTVEDSIKATRILKDLGFKINYHYMLGLPGSEPAKDLLGLRELFSRQEFRPDMLKIYPCMVMKGTKLYREWKKKKFMPISTKDAAELIMEFKRDCPEYLRIMRVQRDIPTYVSESGVDRTNLRQMVQEEMKNKGIACRCIRCREIGRLAGKGRTVIRTIAYDASEGKEYFISAVKGNALLGFCRMRLPSESKRKEITKDSVLIRELHVYGEAAGVGEKVKEKAGKSQHKGIGKKLLREAERIAKDNGRKKIVVISGIGAREYYRKLGYRLEGPYMVKKVL